MTHAQFAADEDALANHFGFNQVAVIGHSCGGFIALEVALRYPQRLSHLILVDTAPTFNYFDDIMENALQLGATEEMLEVLSMDFTSDEEMRQMLPTIWPLYFKHFDEKACKRLLENSILTVSGSVREGEAEAYNMVPHLSKIQIPTLVLVGRYDFVCPPSQAQILHDRLPNSELVIFEDSGHLPYIEESEVFFNTIRDWIERTS